MNRARASSLSDAKNGMRNKNKRSVSSNCRRLMGLLVWMRLYHKPAKADIPHVLKYAQMAIARVKTVH